jgi:tetratricopeptide (TPR) repeat protein
VIGLTIALVVVPLVWAEVPVEIARWYRAAAEEAELDGDVSLSLGKLNHALGWSPNDSALYLYRSALNLEAKELSRALADVDRAKDLGHSDPVMISQQRALCLQRLGRHEEAIAETDRIVRLVGESAGRPRLPGMPSRLSYDSALNFRAYARALAQRDLSEALRDIENAILRSGDQLNHAYLDTRGYLHFLLGDLENARVDMDRALADAEAEFRAFKAREKPGDPRLWAIQEKVLEANLAVIYHHRGLVYQQLGQLETAEHDLSRADELGFSPEDGVW